MGTTQSVQSVRKVSFEDIIDTVFIVLRCCCGGASKQHQTHSIPTP